MNEPQATRPRTDDQSAARDAPEEPDQPPSPGPASPDPAPDRCAAVEVIDETGALTATQTDTLAGLIARAADAVAPGLPHDVRALVVRDERMAELHEHHTGVPGTTDVLTFDLRDDPAADPPAPFDVDLLLCLDVAERAAAERPHDALTELALYAVHGLLHCAGHDDHSEESSRAMHEREDGIMHALGLGRPYAARPRDGGDQ